MIAGIDLGTTNSLISCFRDGQSRLIPNALGGALTPSVVSVLKNGDIVVGQAAKERLYTHPDMTAAAFKRFMGTKKLYSLGRHKFTPVELSSLVLKSLKADAEAALGAAVEEAVISVPAYFNDQQRRATKQAGELAGLRVERLVSEPTAAALAYGLHEGGEEQQFLVFDIGGGTFDVSVVEMFDEILEVKAVAGNNFLGGEDFDKVIVDWFIDRQQLSVGAGGRSIIKERAEAVKRALSSSESAVMRVVLEGKGYEGVLTRAAFEKMSEPILSDIRQPVLRAMRDAKLSPEELSNVILVGGTSRMPLIRNYAARLFKRPPMAYIDPDEAVGLGAAVCAALKGRNRDLGERMMTDVCPYTLGIETAKKMGENGWADNIYAPIIERNTPIPHSRVKRFVSIADNQAKVSIKVYQGESRQADQNLKLGELSLPIPRKPAGESEIDVRFTYDINGILEVEATILSTGEKRSKVIVNSENQMTGREIGEALKRVGALKIHPREHAANRALLERAERMYEESLGQAREEISDRLFAFEAALRSQDTDRINGAFKAFEEFLDGVGARA